MGRVAGVTMAVLLLGGALWLGTRWVEDPPDGTCGALYRPDLWRDRSDCRVPMAVRATGSGVLVLGAVLVLVTSTGRVRRHGGD
jgi:hypothetical protein